MRIIYLHQYFKIPSENGGTRSYDLAKSFVHSGHIVDMVTTTSDTNLRDSKSAWVVRTIDGITVHYMYLPYDNSMTYFQRIVAFLKFMLYASFKLLQLKGDILLATSTPLTIGVPALIKKWFHRIPFVFEVRDVWPEAVIAIGAIDNKYIQRLLFLLEKLIYEHADAIVTLSADMQQSIISRYPKFERKCKNVIENISEVERFSQDIVSEFSLLKWIGSDIRFAVLYAGTFGKVNNIDYVLNLAKETFKIDPSIGYILLGTGSEKDRIIQESKVNGLYGLNVFFPNAVNKSQLNEVYSVIHIGSSFVAPIKELWANSANKFFDTLAAKKPILINHEGWQANIIRKENLGFVLNSTLSTDEVVRFVEYTKNTKLHEQQALNALRIAINKYSLSVASKKYLSIFHSLYV